MTNLFASASAKITPRQAISGVADREQTLRVVCGEVWITIEGVSHDYWLSAGETLKVAPGRLVVVEADRLSSRIDVSHPAQPMLKTHHVGILERVQHFARHGKVLAG